MFISLLSLSADNPFRAVGRTNEDRLRVRDEPTLTGKVVGSLAVDTDIEILDVTSDEMVIGKMSARWYKIQSLPGGDPIAGWAYGFFIDVRPEDLLAIATWVGRSSLIQELIDTGVDVNARLEEEGLVFDQYDEYNYKSVPLIEAVMAQSVDIVVAPVTSCRRLQRQFWLRMWLLWNSCYPPGPMEIYFVLEEAGGAYAVAE